MKAEYIALEDLEVYQLAREFSRESWTIYNAMNFQDKKIMGDQWIRAVDSVGANIAEGYRRYHFLEKIKFYSIARASLSEAFHHWASLLTERKKLSDEQVQRLGILAKKIEIKINKLISRTHQLKQDTK